MILSWHKLSLGPSPRTHLQCLVRESPPGKQRHLAMSEAHVRNVVNMSVSPLSADAGTFRSFLQFRAYGDFPAFEHNSPLVFGGLGSWSDAFPRQTDQPSGMGLRGRRCTSAASSQFGPAGAPGFRDSPAAYSIFTAFANSLTNVPTCTPRYKPDRTLRPAFVNSLRRSRGPSLWR